eukprot:TRINITY_DN3323_c0_g1_i2.p1 TRINITY_DN3323_c0_g1~~TRINITY_DN3323_c0_g1_i2.p1  ORF type:complete len:563 (-),score=127.36 TRINITY_DN3323_c0_g1_i2:64-1752(-)
MQLIETSVNGDYFYRATVVLKEKTYHVQSTSLDILKELTENPTAGLLFAHRNKILQTEVEGESTTYYHSAITKGKVEEMKKAAFAAGVPLVDEYDFVHSPLPSISIDLKSTTKPRFYQKASVQKLFWNDFKCHSGNLVLPCGAGKTLAGIQVLATLKKPTIIFCNSILALNQWRGQLLKWTNINRSSVSRFASEFLNEWDPQASVVISTYAMFTSTENRGDSAMNMINHCTGRQWGLIVLDEVHLAPAKVFRQVTNGINAHVKLGLTATDVREDTLIEELPHLVGPKLYELDIFTLRMQNHIAPVHCTEIHCPLTDIFGHAFDNAPDARYKRLLYTLNPNKARIVGALIDKHLAQNHKIMIFCDDIFALKVYSTILKKTMVSGSTPTSERERIIGDFIRDAAKGECVLFSSVGDQSIDLPEAHVVIQIALMNGSRMQEGQRIGRVQRPMPGKDAAYFYSLITDDSAEAAFAARRHQFLVDHGYSVKMIEGDEWETIPLPASLSVVEKNVQNGFLREINRELKARKEGKAALKLRAQQSRSHKRKVPSFTRIDQMRSKIRRRK